SLRSIRPHRLIQLCLHTLCTASWLYTFAYQDIKRNLQRYGQRLESFRCPLAFAVFDLRKKRLGYSCLFSQRFHSQLALLAPELDRMLAADEFTLNDAIRNTEAVVFSLKALKSLDILPVGIAS